MMDDIVPPEATIAQARSRLEERGYFCTWGGSPLLENVGARFLVCSPSCHASSHDGWWVYLSEVVGKGVQFIEPGHAGSSLIKPFLPEGCPPSEGSAAPAISPSSPAKNPGTSSAPE